MTRFQLNKIARLSIILAILASFTSCKTREKLVYIPQVKTEYITKHTRDSIFQKDSVYIYQRGDTVFKNRFQFIYKDKWRTDTLIRSDTVSVVLKVKEEVKVNYLTKWQAIRLNIFNYLIVGLIAVLIYIFRVPIWRIIKLILRIS